MAPSKVAKRRVRKTLVWVFAVLSALLLLLAVSLSLLLGTEKGRLWLVNTGIDMGLGEGPLQVVLEGESSPSLGQWSFDRVVVSRDQETWLDIRELTLRWHPRELLQKRVHVDAVTARSLDVYPDAGTPKEEEPEPPKKPGGGNLPSIAIESFELARLSIHTDSPDIPDYQLAGDLYLFWEQLPLQVNLDVRSLPGSDQHVPMHLTVNSTAESPDKLRLKGSLEEAPGGLLGKLLQLPNDNGIEASFETAVSTRANGYDLTLTHLQMPFLHRTLAASGEAFVSNDWQQLELDRLRLLTDEQEHSISGTLTRDHLDLQVVARKFPLDLVSPWVEQVTSGHVSAQLQVRGSPTEPQVTGNISGSSDYAGHAVALELAGEFSRDQLNFERLHLEFGEAQVQADGRVDLRGENTGLNFSVQDAPASYLSLAGVDIPEDLTARLVSAEGRLTGYYMDPAAQVAARAEGTYRKRSFNIELDAQGDRQRVSLASLTLESEGARVGAQGVVDVEGSGSDLHLEMDSLPLSLLQLADLELPEALEDLDAIMSGSIDLTGALTAPQASGRVQAVGHYRQRAFDLRLTGSGNQRQVMLQELQANIGEAKLGVSGTIDLEGKQTDTRITLSKAPLDLLELADIELPPGLVANVSGSARVAGPLTAPRASGEVSATGRFDDQPFDIRVAGSGNQRRVTLEEAIANIGDASLNVKGVLDLEGQETDVDVALNNASLELLELAQIELPDDLTAVVSGSASLTGALTSPQVRSQLRAEGQYTDVPFELTANGSLLDRRLDVERVQLDFDGATALAVEGYLQPDAYDLHLVANDLPTQTLSALGWDLVTGDFNGDLRVQGTPDAPSIEGRFSYTGELSGLDLASGEKTTFELGWHTHLTTEEQVLQVVSEFTRNQAETGRFELNLPITDYLTHMQQNGARENLPITFDANGAVDLAVLSLVLDPDIHRISGRAALRMEGRGNLGEPALNGVFELLNTRYENTLSGTLLNDIQLLLRSSGTRVTIEEGRAQGGGNGRVEIGGMVDWSQPQDKNAVDIQITARNANLINREDLDGEVSGDLSLAGGFDELWLRGEVNVMPLSANIDAALQSDIPEIEVTEVYGDPEDVEEEAEPITLGPTVNLDLVIKAEQQAYLRGRGLEAELRGEIHLRGTLDDPTYEGEFSIVRGVFEVFGRKFTLDQGEVIFANNALYMLIPGEYEHDEYTIRAELSGTVEDLSLNLSSVPDLPEDEILSLLIFGKSAQHISPFQALRLATAIQTLRGGGGGFDPIGSTRDMLGVDTLSVETASSTSGTTGVAVGVGKYINERVYLEVRRTPNETQPWEGSVEIELTPRLHLKSTTGGDGRTGADLLWKRDF